eukprot:1402651-Pyramimonas_sp.AAC.1
MAPSANFQLRQVGQERTHEAQQGLIPGRSFLSNIIALDSEARKACVTPEAESDLPIFAANDVEAAFPPLGHQAAVRDLE